jgi:hypothetical protein
VTKPTLQAAGAISVSVAETRSVTLKGIKDRVEVASVQWQDS